MPMARDNSLTNLPPIEVAVSPLVSKNLKIYGDDNVMKQSMEHMAAYNRLKAQFRQEDDDVPYIFGQG